MRVGSLFAGIGGMDLGLERAGMEVVWQVEIDPFCQRVLAKHWPDAKRFNDVREVGAHNLEPVDLICGGFPCQDISHAGKGRGIENGTRSGLWFEMHRIIRELRPRVVLVENVAALLVRGAGTVLGDLAESGHSAEWGCLPASSVGAPHRRDRVFIIAYPDNTRRNPVLQSQARVRAGNSPLLWESFRTTQRNIWLTDNCGLSGDVDGVPDRMDRLKSLGNAVVPQVAEWIGRRIMEAREDG